MFIATPLDKFEYLPKDLSENLNERDLVTFHYSDFNDCYNEAISWNNLYAGSNCEVRFRLKDQFMTAFLHRLGM